MNLPAICVALAQQPGIGRERIIILNGLDSTVDPVGAILVWSGINPLDLQYYCNIPNEKLWDGFKQIFITLGISVADLGYLFHLVDQEIPITLDNKTRRDRVINHLLRKHHFA